MGSLIGKRALVTGAEQGIGRAVAEQLVDAGCDVAIHYFSSAEGPEQTVARAAGLGRRAARFQADCTDEAATNALVDDAASFLGGLDILINNIGGLIGRRGLAEVDLAFWRTVIDGNSMITADNLSRAEVMATSARHWKHAARSGRIPVASNVRDGPRISPILAEIPRLPPSPADASC